MGNGRMGATDVADCDEKLRHGGGLEPEPLVGGIAAILLRKHALKLSQAQAVESQGHERYVDLIPESVLVHAYNQGTGHRARSTEVTPATAHELQEL